MSNEQGNTPHDLQNIICQFGISSLSVVSKQAAISFK